MASGWFTGGLILLVIAGAAGFYWSRNKISVADLELQRKSRILTAAERNFFECLMNSLSDDFYIFAKIRILDVIEAGQAANWLQSKQIGIRLADESFDYLLCKKADMTIFGVIELENFEKGSDKKIRISREKLVSDVCKTANLRLFYFDIRQDYRSMDIRRLVTGRSSKSSDRASPTHQSQLSIDGSSTSEIGTLRTCPKCHSEVVTKVAVKGKRIGEKFLMCRKYPYCDYQVSLNDAKVLRMQKKEASQKTKKRGFSDWAG